MIPQHRDCITGHVTEISTPVDVAGDASTKGSTTEATSAAAGTSVPRDTSPGGLNTETATAKKYDKDEGDDDDDDDDIGIGLSSFSIINQAIPTN